MLIKGERDEFILPKNGYWKFSRIVKDITYHSYVNRACNVTDYYKVTKIAVDYLSISDEGISLRTSEQNAFDICQKCATGIKETSL